MINSEQYKAILPKELYELITDICKTFQEIQVEAAGIAHQANVPDSSMHLQDVLQSTEQATHTILDSATAIQGLSGGGKASEEEKKQIGDLVTKIYEACNFQDISGQRIKKVLKSLDTLEARLKKLAEVAQQYTDASVPSATKPVAAPLMNGPQLSDKAPCQADVDKLFSSN